MTNKRLLKQQYLQTTVWAGVYAIRNVITGRALVAGSKNVEAALNRHCFELRHGNHRNRLLSQDWSRYGASGFEFDVLGRIEPSDEAGFDLDRELEELVNLWRDEILIEVEKDYEFDGATA